MNCKQLSEISKKQEEIIDLVFRFRFINRKQLQKIFGYKDPKSVNTLLKDLVEKGYLGRIYSTKLLENTKPAIYFLQNNGILWIRYQKGEEWKAENEQLNFKHLKKFYEDKHASQIFITHCLGIVEIYLQLKELEKNGKGKLEYYISTKTESWIEEQLHKYPGEDFLDIKNCIPDILLNKEKDIDKQNMSFQTFFIELFDSHVPRYAIRFKVNEYLRLHDKGDWKYKYDSTDGKFPTILFIFCNQTKVNTIANFIQERLDELYDVESVTFLLTTYEKVISEGIGTGNIWKEIKGE